MATGYKYFVAIWSKYFMAIWSKYFMAIWSKYFNGHLVNFVSIFDILWTFGTFSRFGMPYQEESGNPGAKLAAPKCSGTRFGEVLMTVYNGDNFCSIVLFQLTPLLIFF
jgi:hypothetical protein